jgi:2-oxo-3-hexenedioate decarboxylase
MHLATADDIQNRPWARRAIAAAVLGDPHRALQLLSEHLERRGESLPAGSLVLADALTNAVPLVGRRRYRLTAEGLGTVSTDA